MSKKKERRPPEFGPKLTRSLTALPMLGDDLYLRMQALNLGVIDTFLEDLETNLLQEYFEIERTPMASATFVSALTQLWTFGVYELLRTWRQRVTEVLRFADRTHGLTPQLRVKALADQKAKITRNPSSEQAFDNRLWPFFEEAANNPAFVAELQLALDRAEATFCRIEALRMHLAKHELPKTPGSLALAPGYGRINMEHGSIYFQVLLRGNEIDVISRRDIADGCRTIEQTRESCFLRPGVRLQLKHIPDMFYGLKRVKVTLADGSTKQPAFVKWGRELIVPGPKSASIDARKVVKVEHAPEKNIPPATKAPNSPAKTH